MSHLTRRKHVLKEMQEDGYELPQDKQQIVRVVCSRGNNLHEVESAVEDEHFLVTMPTKFRKNVWVKRGDYILVDPIEEGDKVKAEICKILTSEHMKEYIKANIWPERFASKNNKSTEINVQMNRYVDSDSDFDDLQPNMNRPLQTRNISDDEYFSSD